MDWLDEELGEYENDYLIIDCPGSSKYSHSEPTEILAVLRIIGQIELYTHHPILPNIMAHLVRSGIRVCALYLLESQFMEDRYKYFR